MQIIPIRASRPALAPVPKLFPPTLDGLLAERQATDRLAHHAALIWRPDFEERLDSWAERLTARIETEDKA